MVTASIVPWKTKTDPRILEYILNKKMATVYAVL